MFLALLWAFLAATVAHARTAGLSLAARQFPRGVGEAL